mgnify:CR=1 FL=1
MALSLNFIIQFIMNFDNLEFHNVAELVTLENSKGLRLQRLTESLRQQINEGTAGCMTSPANSEIRFRLGEGCESAIIRLASEQGAWAYIFHGPFQGVAVRIEKEVQEIEIKPHPRLGLLSQEQIESLDYHPELIRICFGDAYPEIVTYHGHNGNVRLPEEGEIPKQRYVAYGSSITHGIRLSGAALSYPAHVAYKLGLDLTNLGASGCCLCEPAMADHLASLPCELMTLELSVNMLGSGFTAEEFKERAHDLVKKVSDADPTRPVVCITIFTHFNDMGEELISPKLKATPEEYREVLRNIVKELNRPNLFLVEGPELLSNLAGMFKDLIHPGARGMIDIGENLVKKISQMPFMKEGDPSSFCLERQESEFNRKKIS